MMTGSSISMWTRNAIYLNRINIRKGHIILNSVIKENLASRCSFMENYSKLSPSGSNFFRHEFSLRRGHSTTRNCTREASNFVRRRVRVSFPSQNLSMRVEVLKTGIRSRIIGNSNLTSFFHDCACYILVAGLLVCYNSSNEAHATASGEDECISSRNYHGKKVYTDYSVIGIPGDGRCLFRSIIHGACLRSGKPAPRETLQRELADELRSSVADELIKRREETEWFIEGDFDTYVAHIRKQHVWGGEPELLMASHVLRMPITVYMYNKEANGIIAIAEYGQEYGEDDPVRVLYHGFGHYDALLIPGKKEGMSKL